MIINVTEVKTERPKYNQKNWFSGKTWIHVVKFQTIINENTNEILNIFTDMGKNHDFKIFKNSKLKFLLETIILADKGYQGLQKIHNNTFYQLKILKIILKQIKSKSSIRILIKLVEKLNMFLHFWNVSKLLVINLEKVENEYF